MGKTTELKFTAEQEAYIISAFRDGVKQLRIAKKLGCGLTPVRRILKRDGLITEKPAAKYKDRPEVQDDLMMRVECRCPRCGKQHFRYLYWAGGFPARKRCNLCEEFVKHGDGRFLDKVISL